MITRVLACSGSGHLGMNWLLCPLSKLAKGKNKTRASELCRNPWKVFLLLDVWSFSYRAPDYQGSRDNCVNLAALG